MKHRYERVFMRTCERFKLNPSNWLPRWTQPRTPKHAAGVFTAAYPFKSREESDQGLDYDNPSYVPAMDFYDVMQSWTFARREAAGKDPFSGWGAFWGFLFEVSIGVYDTTNWKESR